MKDRSAAARLVDTRLTSFLSPFTYQIHIMQAYTTDRIDKSRFSVSSLCYTSLIFDLSLTKHPRPLLSHLPSSTTSSRKSSFSMLLDSVSPPKKDLVHERSTRSEAGFLSSSQRTATRRKREIVFVFLLRPRLIMDRLSGRESTSDSLFQL